VAGGRTSAGDKYRIAALEAGLGDVCVHKARLSSSFVDTGNINKDQRAVVVPICGMRVDSTALREHTQIAAFDHAPDPFCDVLCRIFIIYIV